MSLEIFAKLFAQEKLEQLDLAAVNAIQLESEKGIADATRAIGYLYEHGIVFQADKVLALEHYRKSASQGSSVAAFNVGLMLSEKEFYQVEPEVDSNSSQREAFKWFEVAYRKGFMPAGGCLAEAYLEGRGTTKDENKAIEILTEAACSDDSESCFRLGNCYRNGTGVPENLSQAERWLDIACRLGHVRACYDLGCMYFNSSLPAEVPRQTALEFFEKAADKGMPEAIEVLSLIHI